MSSQERSASAELHARVRGFGRACLAAEAPRESFEQLALAIASHQRRHNPVLARLWAGAAQSAAVASALSQIPAVPADAFRLGRVASFEPLEDCARFQTSGTTGGAGVHVFRTLETYRELSVAWAARELFGELAAQPRGAARWTVLALAPVFEPERRSSLGYMMQELMRELDGRRLDGPAGSGAVFDPREPGRWLVTQGRLDRVGLERGVCQARERGERVALLATSFALSWLLEALGGERLPLPPGSVVMQTGGFKGHVRTLDDAELAAATCAALALQPRQLIGEYGMTELSSQLYDTGFGCGPGGQSCYREPPWLRVTPVDPITLLPVPEGEVGLARFTDLANVDSSLVILTQDQVRRVPGGVLLLGRRRGASLRGCSLAVEALMAPGPEQEPT